MIRITSNDDIAFNVNDIRGKGERYNMVFYTVDHYCPVKVDKTFFEIIEIQSPTAFF